MGWHSAYRNSAFSVVGAALVLQAVAIQSAGAQTRAPAPVTLAAALAAFPLSESAKAARDMVPNWHKPRKIVVVVGDDAKRAAWLQAGLPGIKIVGVRDNAAATPELADADALVFGSCQAPAVIASKSIEWVHTESGGSDTCTTNPGVAKGSVIISNSQKVKNDRLSELGMEFVYALAGSLDVALQNMKQGDFHAINGRRPLQLQDSTMLVVGLGGSGTAVAQLAHAAGMHVLATKATKGVKPDFVDYLGLADETPKLASQADIIMIAAPLTPETKNLFNADMFAKMKHGAMLVDYTRAEIINLKDLVAALKSGQVGSAGIDWAGSEKPPAKDDPIWQTPNLIMTGPGADVAMVQLDAAPRTGIPAPGDIAGQDYDNELRWILVRENMRRFANGEKMYSVFDVARGY